MKKKKKGADLSAEQNAVLGIDLHRLEEEWQGQPQLFREWAARLANADSRVDDAKAELELVAAEIDSSIRSDPDKYGLEKVTDKAIEATALRQEEYQEALREHREAVRSARLLRAMVTSLDHRKKALEKIVDLHGQSYWSKPREKKGSTVMSDAEIRRIREAGQYKRKK